MNELTVFNNEEFGEIRTITIDGEPWFVGKDVAEVLGYSNPRKAMIDHVDTEDKGVTKCDTLGGAQEMAIINESGLYSLIISSKLPNAKAFKRWVTYIRDEEERQAHNIELIALENFVSDNVLKAVGSCLTNKYSKGYKEEDFVNVAQTIDGIINKEINK